MLTIKDAPTLCAQALAIYERRGRLTIAEAAEALVYLRQLADVLQLADARIVELEQIVAKIREDVPKKRKADYV